MNLPLVLATLLSLTAPLVVAGGPPATTDTAAPVVAAPAADGVVRDVAQATDEDGVRLAEVDLAVPAADDVVDGATVLGPFPATAPDAAGAPIESEAPEEAPVAPTKGTTVVADEVAGSGLVETAPVDTEGYQTLGITWPADVDPAGLGAHVRTSSDGQWGEWVALDASDSPDPGTADAANELRGGTDPLWIGDADAVQLAFAATDDGGPDGLSLALVGSEAEPAGTTTAAAVETVAATDAATTADVVFMAAAQTAPRIISRGQWGAPAPTCRTDSAAKLVGAVVHHTAGSNSYSSVAQAMQQIRNDAKYHMTGRGWCDLGYNFVVDKWGNIYEGRAGSMTKAVIGVHAGGFNTGTVGVSMLGTYTAAPSAATQRAVGEVIGWRLGAYGVDPRGSMTYWTGAGQNSKYSNRNVTLPRIFGHRDVAYTACPGPGGYSALPAIREIAADAGASERFAQARSVVTALYHDLLGRAPDASGLAMWTGKLAAGVDQSELVYLLTRSDEYIALRVAQAYQTVLGRAPEPAGARHWLTEIRGGTASVDDVQRRFFDSDEFAIRAGGTFDSYASAVYRAALGRSISSMERPARAAQVASNGRGWVIDDVWFSTEAAARRAGTYYEVFLQRAPDSVGVAHWAGVLLNQSESAVRTGIAGSAEYRDRAVARYP